MNVKIIGRKVNLRENFKKLVNKKLARFERIFDEDADAAVTVTWERNRQTVEITIKQRGVVYRAEASDFEMNDALDQAVSALGRQIRKNKTRLAKQLRAGALEDYMAEELYNEEPEDFEVVKTKKFSVKPLSVEEAILQMNLLDHQFFMFRNVETEEINVVYKRNSGGYGLLEPD
jgi:putative sigma-54 modulation protein